MMQRETARGVIVRDGKILMFERWRRRPDGTALHYFSIPGGGIEKNETPEDAVVREMKEEMSITVRPLRLLARQRAPRHAHHYFLCEIVEGEPRFNTLSEEAAFGSYDHNRYEIAWVPLTRSAEVVRHTEYAQFLARLPGMLDDPQADVIDMVAE